MTDALKNMSPSGRIQLGWFSPTWTWGAQATHPSRSAHSIVDALVLAGLEYLPGRVWQNGLPGISVLVLGWTDAVLCNSKLNLTLSEFHRFTLWGWDQSGGPGLIHVKHIKQCQAHGRYSIHDVLLLLLPLSQFWTALAFVLTTTFRIVGGFSATNVGLGCPWTLMSQHVLLLKKPKSDLCCEQWWTCCSPK